LTKRPILAVAAVSVLAAGVAAPGSTGKTTAHAAAGVTLNGAGSTFAAPIYQQIGSELKPKGVTINYAGGGSGAGVAQFTAGTVDFAGSDPSLLPAESQAAAKKGGPVQNLPIALGAITVSYNLPGVKSGLKLDGATIASIYLNKVKKWNDPAIAKLNKGTKLPNQAITVVHRSDSSGTTKGFTTFLAAYSAAWKNGPGVDKVVQWPTGTGGNGNPGVAAAVKQTKGAIGYVEQAFALQNHFTFAAVKNSKGKYILPTLPSTAAAGLGLKVPSSLSISVINAPNSKAYPITSQTFIIYHRDLCLGGLSAAKAKGMSVFLNYLLGTGQGTIQKLSYAPLPAGLLAKAKAAVKKVNCSGKPIK